MTPKEKVYFQAFTKKKRNINKTKEKHLKKFFPLIGLTTEQAEEVYNYTHTKKAISSLSNLLALPHFTKTNIQILKKYFIANKTDSGYVQDLSFSDILSQVINDESDTEDSDLRLTLEKYKNNPLDLNSATEDDLSIFPWLSPFMILKILQYQKNPGFKKIDDLKKIDGFDDDMLAKTKPFVYVKPLNLSVVEKKIKAKRTKLIKGTLDTRILTSYPYSEEYLKKYYLNSLGLKEKLNLEFFKYFKTGIVLERDIGEKNLNDSQKFFLSYDNENLFLSKIILGNFRLNFGQALTISDSGAAKSPAVLNIKNKGKPIKPDLSSYEDKNYFGIVSKFKLKNFSFIGFYSKRRGDAKIEDWATFGDGIDNTPDNTSDNVLSGYSPDSDGYHRTPSDEATKDLAEKTLFGGHGQWNYLNEVSGHAFKIGTTYYRASFNYPVMKDYKNDYFYKFRGKTIQQFGFNWDILLKHINFFGEISASIHPNPLNFSIYSNTVVLDSSILGMVGGILFTSKIYKTALLFRHYGLNFFSFENSPFSENSSVNGETGFYSSHQLKLSKSTKINGYFDVFSKSWRKYDENRPTIGYENFWSLEQKLKRKLIAYFQMKTENKDMKMTLGDNSAIYRVNNDWRFRYELQWEANSKTKYRMRYETAFTKVPDLNLQYHSSMIFGNIRLLLAQNLTLYLRNIIFDGNYDAGIWEYENDIPAYMASSSFSGQGNRVYLLIKQKLIPKKLTIYFKTGATYFFRKYEFSPSLSEIGTSEESSTDTLVGDTKFDFRFELIYNF